MAPGGVAVFVEVLTDNKNRIASEMRHMFSKYGGNMGENGCVAWMFKRCGEITIEGENLNEDAIMEAAIEAGADDVQFDDGTASIYTPVEDVWTVYQTLTDGGHKPAEPKLTRIPQNTVKLEGKPAETMIKLMELLEDNDDVQNVYANFDISDEILEKMAE